MPSRTGFTVKERALYSKLRQLLNEPGLVRGSLVEMRRQCGKGACACATDPARRHRSLYLGLSVRGQRRMLYIPPAWEPRVRRWTEHYAEVREVLEELSRQYVQQLERRAE
jgi:uncharacterized protein DUF6788